MITISKTHFSDIQAHSRETYPDECVGAMIGTVDSDTSEKHVTALIRIENQSTENKRRRFMVTDADYQFVEAEAKKQGVQLLGFYHSHPDHPAQPSETDLKFAWPFFSYVIQSVFVDDFKEMNSFELDLDAQVFKEEVLIVD